MAKTKNTVATIHEHKTGKSVAMIMLNGYNIEQGDIATGHGSMRSFKIIHGDLSDIWDNARIFQIKTREGEEKLGRIAAYPSEYRSAGLVEFLPMSRRQKRRKKNV